MADETVEVEFQQVRNSQINLSGLGIEYNLLVRPINSSGTKFYVLNTHNAAVQIIHDKRLQGDASVGYDPTVVLLAAGDAVPQKATFVHTEEPYIHLNVSGLGAVTSGGLNVGMYGTGRS